MPIEAAVFANKGEEAVGVDGMDHSFDVPVAEASREPAGPLAESDFPGHHALPAHLVGPKGLCAQVIPFEGLPDYSCCNLRPQQTVIDSPSYPVRPRKALNILLAVVFGLLGGVGLAFFREYMDNTVKTPADVEYLTRLPALAVVPAHVNGNGHGRFGMRHGRLPRLLKGRTVEEIAGPPVELISHSEPQSPVSEAFRALRTSLLLSQAEHPPQVILISSALPKEGKTTAALNLAVTLAQLGDRTVLVDADLRKPGVAKAMGIKDGKMGLTNFLVGNSDLEQVARAHPDIANLSAVPTGPVPANPAELLSSQRLRQAIEGLRKDYKFIVLDSPPVLSATDAVILSVAADCVVLVVRSGETPKEAFSRASDLLAGVNCRLVGVVLNAVDFSSYDYYYSYKYYPYPYGGNPTHQQDS